MHLTKQGNHFIQEILLRKNINEPPIRENQSVKKFLTFLYFFYYFFISSYFSSDNWPFYIQFNWTELLIGFYSINDCGTFIFYRWLAIKNKKKHLK